MEKLLLEYECSIQVIVVGVWRFYLALSRILMYCWLNGVIVAEVWIFYLGKHEIFRLRKRRDRHCWFSSTCRICRLFRTSRNVGSSGEPGIIDKSGVSVSGFPVAGLQAFQDQQGCWLFRRDWHHRQVRSSSTASGDK